MTQEIDVYTEIAKFIGATAVLSGAMAGFWRKGSEADDAMTANACDTVIDSAINADLVGRVDMRTGKNLRDQISVQELEELNRERELRRFKNRN